jgi:hypothetical protein
MDAVSVIETHISRRFFVADHVDGWLPTAHRARP